MRYIKILYPINETNANPSDDRKHQVVISIDTITYSDGVAGDNRQVNTYITI